MSINKIEFSETDGNAFFNDIVATEAEQVEVETTESADNAEVVSTTDNNQVATTEDVTDVEIADGGDKEEEYETAVVSKDVSSNNTDNGEQPEATQKIKPKAKVKYKDEYHAALNKYISENDEYSVEEFNRMYNGLPKGMPDLDVIKAKFYNDPANEGISQRALASMFERELDKYSGLYSEDEDEREIAEGLLKRDANIYLKAQQAESLKFREQYKADMEQEIEFDGDFEPEQVQGKSEEELRLEREATINHYKGLIDPIIGDGFLTLKDKEGEIKIPIADPSKIIEAAVDPVKFLQGLIIGEDGKVSIDRFVEVVAFATNKNQYNSTLIKHSKGLGTQKIVAEIKNTAPISGPKPTGQVDENSPDFFENMIKNASKRAI